MPELALDPYTREEWQEILINAQRKWHANRQNAEAKQAMYDAVQALNEMDQAEAVGTADQGGAGTGIAQGLLDIPIGAGQFAARQVGRLIPDSPLDAVTKPFTLPVETLIDLASGLAGTLERGGSAIGEMAAGGRQTSGREKARALTNVASLGLGLGRPRATGPRVSSGPVPGLMTALETNVPSRPITPPTPLRIPRDLPPPMAAPEGLGLTTALEQALAEPQGFGQATPPFPRSGVLPIPAPPRMGLPPEGLASAFETALAEPPRPSVVPPMRAGEAVAPIPGSAQGFEVTGARPNPPVPTGATLLELGGTTSPRPATRAPRPPRQRGGGTGQKAVQFGSESPLTPGAKAEVKSLLGEMARGTSQPKLGNLGESGGILGPWMMWQLLNQFVRPPLKAALDAFKHDAGQLQAAVSQSPRLQTLERALIAAYVAGQSDRAQQIADQIATELLAPPQEQ